MFPFAGPAGLPTTLVAEPEVTRLHTGVSIGGLALANRVVMAAMATGFASADGLPSPRLVAWYAARAAGGVGLVIVESTLVEPPDPRSPAPNPRLRLAADAAIPAFAALAEAIHRAGARAAIELNHRPVADPAALPRAAIEDAVRAFGAAAGRARAAGFDALELQCSHRSLLGQLLSPASNRRRDRYGRNPAGRLRALLEAIAAARSSTGDALPIVVKFSADEYLPRGVTPELAAAIARRLEAAGVAALEVVAGSPPADALVRLSAGAGEATQADLAAAVKAAVAIPVLAAGRILSSASVEQVLRDGQADLVALGRALLADPAWVAKVRAGVELELIPCIGCMACFTPGPDGATGCPVNGEAGREHLPPLAPAAAPRRIAVAGASLAGLELARVAASRGHHVEIATAGLPLGGLLGLRAGVPGNAEYGRAFLYFGDRLVELGVGIVEAPSPGADVTVDCRPPPEIRPPWARGRALLLASELLGRDLHELYGIGRRVAVVGPGALAAEVALFLAGWGRRPTVVVPGPPGDPFPDVHPVHATRLVERLAGYKVPLLAGATPLEWIYDVERKSQLHVLQHAHEQRLGPFHSAVSVAGWPPVRGQGSGVRGQGSAGSPPGTAPATPAMPAMPAGVGSQGSQGSRRVRRRGQGAEAGDAAEGELGAAPRWPSAVALGEPPEEVPSGATITLGDTPYAEPLRDLVAYAHLLARVI